MIKQVYKFLSIVLVSNLIMTSAALSKQDNNAPVCQKRSFIQWLFGCKKPCEQKPGNQTNNQNGQNNVVKPPAFDDNGPYVTKYGVYFSDDVYKTYPQPDKK